MGGRHFLVALVDALWPRFQMRVVRLDDNAGGGGGASSSSVSIDGASARKDECISPLHASPPSSVPGGAGAACADSIVRV